MTKLNHFIFHLFRNHDPHLLRHRRNNKLKTHQFNKQIIDHNSHEQKRTNPPKEKPPPSHLSH